MKELIIADSNIPFVESMFKDMAKVCLLDSSLINNKTVQDADILLVRSVTRVGKELLNGSRIKFVGTVTSGYDHIDLDYLSSKGIKFFYAPGCNSNSVAEYITAALLFLHRNYNINLREISLGVVGVGNIGSKVVRKAKALGVKVLQNDPPLQRKTGESGFVQLDDLMKCDIITLHVPLTFEGDDATYHLFDEERISAMKPGSILINTSRGSIVETEALLKALGSGHLCTAVLDVWENEPEINTDLLSMAAIGTPHIAGYSVEGKINGVIMIYNAVCTYLNVNPNWNPEGKLPPPQVSEIKINRMEGDDQNLIYNVVQQCYSIENDDKNFRKLLDMNAEDGKEYFNKLRKEYPVRREFAATSVEVAESVSHIGKILNGIGFSVKQKIT